MVSIITAIVTCCGNPLAWYNGSNPELLGTIPKEVKTTLAIKKSIEQKLPVAKFRPAGFRRKNIRVVYVERIEQAYTRRNV